MILKFDQTPAGFTSQHKTTCADKGSESAPITNVDAKRQITSIFCISLSAQLACGRLSNRYHWRVKFPQFISYHSLKL